MTGVAAEPTEEAGDSCSLCDHQRRYHTVDFCRECDDEDHERIANGGRPRANHDFKAAVVAQEADE